MEMITEWFAWLIGNYKGILLTVPPILISIYGVLGMIFRLTPTERDDDVLERVGKIGRRIFDILGVPNKKAGGGAHEPRVEDEQTQKIAQDIAGKIEEAKSQLTEKMESQDQ